ncbi:MAG: response regulator transcription factor [Burkholderiaceae bacterium]|nr:response regulator transcription factor [Burkholderiaceae bacterium]
MSTKPSAHTALIPGETLIGVLVVDDQPAVRDGVAQLISCAPLTLREICTAASGTEARAIAKRLKPELVILDADLHGEDGLALIGQFGQAALVLVLTSHGDAATRRLAKSRGAAAFVEKQQPASELLAAIVQLATTQKH